LAFRHCLSLAALIALLFVPASAAGQAFTPPKGVGSVTFAGQWIDNTGHRQTDGNLVKRGQSDTTSLLAEVEFGFTERLAATIGIPFVSAKYTGTMPPPSNRPVDDQRWHSGFQDFGFGIRYHFGDEFWGVTPLLRYGLPSHNYPFQGEAVVGRKLNELQIGVSSGLKLVNLLPKASIQGTYTYGIVEQPVSDIPLNRSNGSVDFGYSLTRSLYLRAGGSFQRTHGGLRVGSDSGIPFPLLGEFNTDELKSQIDRLTRSNYWHAGGGLAYSFSAFDVFLSYEKYVWGRDTHNGAAYTLGATWYFDLSR